MLPDFVEGGEIDPPAWGTIITQISSPTGRLTSATSEAADGLEDGRGELAEDDAGNDAEAAQRVRPRSKRLIGGLLGAERAGRSRRSWSASWWMRLAAAAAAGR